MAGRTSGLHLARLARRTDPLDSSDIFHTRIGFRDGAPVILPSHDLGATRAYIVDGKETLDGAWGPTNANSRFFRIRVAIPDQSQP